MTITLRLTPEQEGWPQARVASGDVASIEDAARRAIDERIAEERKKDRREVLRAGDLSDEDIAAIAAEHRGGLEEGVKDRPCVVILLAKRADTRIVVTVVPVTHTPRPDDEAVELPPATKRRLGLDDARSWVVVSEVNRFVWPGPDLRPVSRDQPDRFDYGILPPSLFRQITDRFAAAVQAQRLAIIQRTE